MLSYISDAFRSLSPDEGVQQRPPRYAGEDTTPTSRREILGWYSYGIAAEVFAVCGVGSFLPLTLEQLARERGTLQTSRLPCTGPSAGNSTNAENGQCVVPVFGLEINTASFAMYTFSVAVLIQALTLISFSALADYENNRKTLLMVFGFAGALASMLFVFVAPPIFVLGSILVVVGVTCLGSSFVVLNSYLPVLVANDPSLQAGDANDGAEMSSFDRDEGNSEWNAWGNDDADDDSLDGLQPPGEPHSSLEGGMGFKASPSSSPELQLSTKISSRGIGLGYCAAVFVQIISIIMLITLSKTSLAKASPSLPMRFVLLLVGIWWGAFTLVTRNLLKTRPGPRLDSVSTKGAGRWRAWLRLIGFAWKSLWKTVKIAMKLREVIIFLVAWFLLSDAMATVSGTAILFARTELKLSTPPDRTPLNHRHGIRDDRRIFVATCITPNHTILLCIGLFELIPLYGLLAYIPFIKSWGVFGLQQPWEIFPLAIVHGVVSGGLASYCRSFFGLLIPPGSEAAFYALYAATDKGSSFIGPAIVGVLVDATGQVRSGFFFIAVLILLPIPLVWMVNADKGRREGLAMAETLDKSHGGPAEYSQEAEGLLARQ
ncbi:Major facilitator superfamily domain general substrate transporter [Penicillium coprophilum]|uniref:Major facilitator superfamily domain general substrate transporter n=1 Tax=Penicillium coprophilum TaxID=36646 RepID=UPI002399993A|nr:Major facilitator superfamily domain general substrate transporter [Penicillium coprophilum]KAJ5153634.1 Major facilitator superfamily domain general substrate transporter [Penicillium coprophilum]